MATVVVVMVSMMLLMNDSVQLGIGCEFKHVVQDVQAQGQDKASRQKGRKEAHRYEVGGTMIDGGVLSPPVQACPRIWQAALHAD